MSLERRVWVSIHPPVSLRTAHFITYRGDGAVGFACGVACEDDDRLIDKVRQDDVRCEKCNCYEAGYEDGLDEGKVRAS